MGAVMELDFKTYYEVVALHAEYAAVVDRGEWDRWPDFFVEDCQYLVYPRENYELGYPLATLAFESKGMLKDRVYGIKETLCYDPHYQHHVVGAPIIRSADSSTVVCEANYTVIRTKYDKISEVFNVGRYIDRLKRTDEGLRIERRLCVFDTEMIPNSLIYPI